MVFDDERPRVGGDVDAERMGVVAEGARRYEGERLWLPLRRREDRLQVPTREVRYRMSRTNDSFCNSSLDSP